MTPSGRIGVVAICAILVACGQAELASTVAIRDSAGIRIIETTQGDSTDLNWWTVSPVPSMDFAARGTNEGVIFERIAGAIRLESGATLVADARAHQLLVIPDVGPVQEIGREGAGPGEFRSIHRLLRARSDTVLVYDGVAQRLSVFDSVGHLVRSSAMPFPYGRLEDGTYISKRSAWTVSADATGLIRDPEWLLRVSEDGVVLDTIARIPGSETYRINDQGMMMQYDPPFARKSALAVSGSWIVTGSGDKHELQWYSTDGRLSRITRVHAPQRHITGDDLDRYKAHLVGSAPNQAVQTYIARVFAEVPVPETMPAYSGALFDSQSNLWVQDYSYVPTESSTWTVLSPHGILVARVRTPPRFRVTDIGADYVLGVAHDDLDVQSVRGYRLNRN